MPLSINVMRSRARSEQSFVPLTACAAPYRSSFITHHLLPLPSQFERNASPSLEPGDKTSPDRRGPGSQQAYQLPIFEMIEPPFGLAALLADNGQVVKSKATASFRRDLVIEIESPHFDRPTTIMTMIPTEIAGNVIAQITQPIIQGLARGLCPAIVPLIKLVGSLRKDSQVPVCQHHRYL